jgi:hypothetical protein
MGVSVEQYSKIKKSKTCDQRYYITRSDNKYNSIMEYSKVKCMPVVSILILHNYIPFLM